jgi:GlpG protein
MIAALELGREVDLGPFIRYLVQQRIPHRVTEQGEQQVLWVGSEEQAMRVHELYQRFQTGALEVSSMDQPSRWTPRGLLTAVRRYPLTLVLIALNVVMFPVTAGIETGDVSGMLQLMTFQGFVIQGPYIEFLSLDQSLAAGEYWRLLSPMLLHFGWLHIVFNMLWVWEIGRRIEVVNGLSVLLLVTLVGSLLSNVTQYLMSGPSLFGGMSGVVFGYLGFALVWSRLVPGRTIGLAPGIYIFMLIYLAIGFTGAIDLLGLGSLANGAHLGGLIAGVLVGTVAGLLRRSG